MGHKPQLTAADVERGLRAAGFTPQPQKGTSHVQWVIKTNTKYLRVTISAHLEPFSKDLVRAMAAQAGMSTNQLYELCTKDGVKQAKKGTLSWLTNLF